MALGVELRSLLRSPLRITLLLAVWISGAIALLLGRLELATWHGAVEAGLAREQQSIAEARALFAAGRTGPEERPWIDLSRPLWQDWYAATRLARLPAPLAPIAFAVAEEGAVVQRVWAGADPSRSSGERIENPELLATGRIDLVMVLTTLLPLLLFALGVEVGAQERAGGIWPLLQVQCGAARRWILARTLAVGLIGAGAGLVLIAAAGAVSGAGLLDLALLGMHLLAYVAVWCGLLAIVTARARRSSEAAIALGSLWMVVCVVVPSAGVQRSAWLAAEDFALDLTVQAREGIQADEAEDPDALLAAVLDRLPGLEGTQLEAGRAGLEQVQPALRLLEAERRLAGRHEREQRQGAVLSLAGLYSPAVAFAHGLDRLAGRDPAVDRQFRRSALEAVADRVEMAISVEMSGRQLTAEDFEALVDGAPEDLRGSTRGAWRELAILLAWALAAFLIAGWIARPGPSRSVPA